MEQSCALRQALGARGVVSAQTLCRSLRTNSPDSNPLFSTRPTHKLYLTGKAYPLTTCNLDGPKKSSKQHSTISAALAERFTQVSDARVPEINTHEDMATRLNRVLTEFKALEDPRDRVMKLLEYSSLLPPLPASERIPSNRVMGCTAQVWLTAEMGGDGRMYFGADSDSEITRGFCSCLINALNGALAEEVLQVKTEDLSTINIGVAGGSSSRANTWYNLLISMHKRIRAILAKNEGKPPVEPFPSLLITAEDIAAQGSFAEAQAKYLSPDASKVAELVDVLKEKQIGVVAHFYMDPEVQGVLVAAKQQWPHIQISDSLVMADRAVKMAEAGCKTIAVLGVDFMSENVRAILDRAGFEKVGVYRMASEKIGCSLADAATSPKYMQFLEAASRSHPSLHVVYINTSLQTKAQAHELVPTITCTSSNVVQTVLQAFAQIPHLTVWYGPDSYMGANLAELFRQMANMTDAEIAEIHPMHDRNSIRSLLHRLHYFHDGTCIVHNLFGEEVVRRVEEGYCDAFLTAHFEVPGEMFSIAMEAKKRGMGVVGSTQNILDFITQCVQEAVNRNIDEHLQFVLGTESGMVTAIVTAVRNALKDVRSANIEVEIIFPVSLDSMSEAPSSGDVKSSEGTNLTKLSIVPGPSSGEGCSIHGGCASCPYMKMNSLDSLLNVCRLVDTSQEFLLSTYEAQRFETSMLSGHSIADLGCEPILHMRHFQSSGKLPDKLVYQVLHRHRE
uniref:Quinolinate synthase, chloroplastic n=2 Tax=Araucaria cunninghamii TaxID=56994 RepID=A0A0D6QTN3_ARACU